MNELEKLLNGKVFFETTTGSNSRGTNIATSDDDKKGIYMVNKESLFSLSEPTDTFCLHEPEDREYHTLKKFLNLAALKGNPTILEMMFTEERFYTYKHPLMDLILENREMFLTKKCYYSFHGYAKDQLMRIKNAKLDTSSDEKQEHLDYVVNRVLRDVHLRYPTFNRDNNFVKLDEVIFKNPLEDKYSLRLDMNVNSGEFTELFGMLNELRNVLDTYNSITGRNKKPNEARLWKHAMQLTILLKMGKEVVEGESLKVYRYDDREELLQIRNGELTWEEFYKYIESLTADLEFSFKNTKLPEQVDTAKLNEIYKEIMVSYYA